MFIFKNKLRMYQHSQLVTFILTTIIGLSTSAFLDATTGNCGKSIIPSNSYDRIVGGTDAVPGEFPWMVSLREFDDYGLEHTCGASILNENWVVTAAHCLDYSDVRRYDILTGLHKLSRTRDSTVKRYKISKIVIHDKFDEETLDNDIALLKTKVPIEISGSRGYINTICLPKDAKDPTGFATAIGWGHTFQDGSNSDTLKKVLVPFVDRETCRKIYFEVDEVSEAMICAGATNRDSCQNDSGGPLFQTDKNGVSTLVGIVSHGALCGFRHYPGVYTKVSVFLPWINKVVN